MPYPRLTRCMPDARRHNPFHALHKTLRYGHCRMLQALGVHDFQQEQRNTALIHGLLALVEASRIHAEAESALLHPALEERRPGAAARAAEAASGHAAAVGEIQSLVRAVRIANPARRNIAGQALYRCYALFAAADLARMDASETSLLSALHADFADPELEALEIRLLRAMPEDGLRTLMTLARDALTESECGKFRDSLGCAFGPGTLAGIEAGGGTGFAAA